MDEMPADGFRHKPIWLLGVAGLLLAQAGLALALFGPNRSWAAVADDRPVTSGRHPLHLYHGLLGAQTFRDRGATTCYDPNFQAGYPKTPVFDGGSRPAELFLVTSPDPGPRAYKTGLFGCVLLVPLAFVLAARGVGLPAGAAVLAGAGGILIGWSAPVQSILDHGDLDLFIAGLAAVVFVGWLVRYARWFGADSWVVLALAAVAGWYAHPVVWLGLFPVVVAYYVTYAPRHGPAWHLGLLGISFAGLAPNMWWLFDWGRYWWLRQPSPSDHIPVPSWEAVLGAPGDYPYLFGTVPGGVAFALVAAAGLLVMWRTLSRGAAGVLIFATLLAVTATRIAASWPRVTAEVPERIAALAAAFLVLPAAFAVWTGLRRARGVATAAAVCALVVVAWADGPNRPMAKAAGLNVEQLRVGFTTDQQRLIGAVVEHTTPAARVLWDDTTDLRAGWNWPALLPVLTGRAYLGGLDHEAGVEHSFCGMRNGVLNGRSLREWTDDDLAKFCHWYNVGWVVCRSAAAAERWGKHPAAEPVARMAEGGQPVVLFKLKRPLSFVLTGTATWEVAGPRRVSLTDVVPDADGGVTLSLHHCEELRAYPSYVKIDSVPDSHDPIKHVRLRLPGPTPRVTIVWEGP